jgi:hypothetical protein
MSEASSGAENLTGNWGVVKDFDNVYVELSNGNIVRISAERFSLSDHERLAMGAVVQIREDGTPRMPEPDYPSAEELLKEEQKADEILDKGWPGNR